MWKEERSNITDSTATSHNSRLILKDVFAWTNKKMKGVVAGEDLKVDLLERANYNNGALIQGRNLYDTARNTMRNLKKAIAFYQGRLGPDGCLPSGTTEEDLLKGVLDDMFSLLKGKPALIGSTNPGREEDDDIEEEKASENNGEEEESSKRPDDWLFHGWFAFLLFGPSAPKQQQLNVLTLGDPKPNGKKGKAKYSRKAQREEEGNTREKERSIQAGRNRGYTVNERINIAAMYQREREYKQGKSDTKAMVLSNQQNMLLRRMEIVRGLPGIHIEKILELDEQIADVQKKIDALISSPSPVKDSDSNRSKTSSSTIESVMSAVPQKLDAMLGLDIISVDEQPPTKRKKTSPTVDVETEGAP